MAKKRSGNSAVAKPKKKSKLKVTYSFRTKVKCPRCYSSDTRSTATREGVQHRRCIRAICKHRFKVFGEKV